MANANLTILTDANTFGDETILVNNLANAINQLRNGLFYADGGSLTLANGTLIISSSNGTVLSISGNATFSQQITTASILNTGGATIQGNTVLFTSNSVLVQVANTVVAKYLISNTNLTAVNVSTNGYMGLSGSSLSNTIAPLISFFNELATLNVNSAFMVSNTGNVYVKGSLDVEGTANIKTLNANTFSVNTLSLGGTADLYDIVFDPTSTYFQQNGNLTINDLIVKGNQTIQGVTTLASDAFQLRTGLAPDGSGYFEVWRGNTLNVNASIEFNNVANVWQATANDAQTALTILTTANLVDSTISTSTTNAATANAVNAAVQQAISGAKMIVASAGAFVAQRQGVDFLANSIISLNVTANSSNTSLVDVKIQANVVDSYLSNSTTAAATANAVNAAYAAAISQAIGNAKAIFAEGGAFVAQRQGVDFLDGNNIVITVTANTGNTSLVDVITSLASNLSGTVNTDSFTMVQPTLQAQKETYVNVGTITGNTIIDCSQGTYFDLTLANNANLTFQNVAPSGHTTTIQLLIRQGANGGNTVTLTNAVHWSDNSTPVLSTGANTMDVLQVFTYNGGSIWWGAQVLANIAGANVY